MTFRFLHLADLHLETRFGGREATRARLRRAALEAFERAVEFALERRLHAVLVAGDLFDDGLLSLRTELELVRQVRRLNAAGCWFLYCCGNHDPGREGGRAARLGLDGLERVRVFRSAEPRVETVLDPAGRPVGRVVGAGHPEDAFGANLCERFPAPRELGADLPRVGLLHTQVETARTAAEHARYAPSHPDDYARLGYDYWALGHVHLRQQAVPGRPVWYAGNLQGRHAKETGPKGGLLVELDAEGMVEPEFVAFAPVRWERRRVADLCELDTTEALAARLEAEIAAAVETEAAGATRSDQVIAVLELAGATPLAAALQDDEQRLALADELAERTGALEVQLRPAGLYEPYDEDALRREPTLLAKALELLELAEADDELVERLLPTPLAAASDLGDQLADDAGRRAYGRELLRGLGGDLIARIRVPEPR